MKKILAVKKPLFASLFIHCAFIAALSAGGPLMVDGPSQGPAVLAHEWAADYGAIEVVALPVGEPTVPGLWPRNNEAAEDGPLPSHAGLALPVEKGRAQNPGPVLPVLRQGEDGASRAPHEWGKYVRGSGDHG